MAKQMSKKVILKLFFGYRPGEGLKQFTEELNQLSPEEQLELAGLAAIELTAQAEAKGKEGIELVVSES